MTSRWRLLDTGRRSAAENIALDAILLEKRANKEIPNTLRFLQFSPQAVLIGYHQTVDQEVRRDYCKRRGIDINRRITGGGAIYFDSSQIGFEIIAERKDFGYRLDTITSKIVKGVILGLKRLGIEANFRPRNDIEVSGRKISGTGGVFEGSAFLFQGTLLVDFDVEEMVRSLKIPVEKLAKHEIGSIRERVTWLSRELWRLPETEEIKGVMIEGFSEAFGVKLKESGLTKAEIEALTERLPYFSSKGWIEEVREPLDYRKILKSSFRAKGGLIKVQLVADIRRRILRQILITGDFFISPIRSIFDLESSLKDTPFDEVKDKVERFFDEKRPNSSLLSEDFITPIREAIDRVEYIKLGFSLDEANSLYPINGSLKEILSSAKVLLLPYCAKHISCKYRRVEGCGECGGCTVGEAYRLARVYNLRPITIQNYEHLKETLKYCQRDGISSYIGCCCEAFFNRRQKVFRETNLSGVLLDIDNTTCYELDKEREALKGEFEFQTNLRIGLLEKVLRCNG